ncbi:MAG: hypothetical protein MI717_14195 [Spirochaetales bacterium]|nr:hypothetical protein [Spirochaetales bacterium]
MSIVQLFKHPASEQKNQIPSLILLTLFVTSCATVPIPTPQAPSKVPPTEPPLTQEIPEEDHSPLEKNQVPQERTLEESVPLSQKRTLTTRVFPQEVQIETWDGQELLVLTNKEHNNDLQLYETQGTAFRLSAPGYISQTIFLEKNKDFLEAKLEKEDSPLTLQGELPTEFQPKSVRFSPDGSTLYVAHLGAETAVNRYSTSPFAPLSPLQVPKEYQENTGFVETAILPKRGEIWVSQMTRSALHIFDLSNGAYLETIELSGQWHKVMLPNAEESRLYVTAWDSKTVIEVDVEQRKELRQFQVTGTPRGLALTPDGSELLVAIFSSSAVDRINLAQGEIVASHDAAPGYALAMRHIVPDRQRHRYYVTAMGVGRVYILSEEGEWLGQWKVGKKPNTCALSPDGSRLFVSCRGPNNPDDGYLFKGYEFGKVYVINLEQGTVEGWIWGKDQPTGLDISPDGKTLAFTDFLSSNLELYSVDEMSLEEF